MLSYAKLMQKMLSHYDVHLARGDHEARGSATVESEVISLKRAAKMGV